MIDDFIESLAARNKAMKKEGDYIKDGILYCGVCNEPKQGIYTLPNGKKIAPAILCKCEREQEEREKLEMIESEKQLRRRQLLKGIIKTDKFEECVFQNDDDRQPEVTAFCKKYVDKFSAIKERGYGIMFKKYVDKFSAIKERGYGIMFYGEENGKGKSFYSLCIANALINRGYPVLFSTLSNLVSNKISVMHGKEEEIDVKEYDLVIIDDLGVENASATAFSIIDEVYSNKIPLIVTTNLTPDKMLRNENLEKRRIYDRLLEACTKKILIKNNGSRAKKGNDNLKDMMEILG